MNFFKKRSLHEKAEELKMLRAKNMRHAKSAKLDEDLKNEKLKAFKNSKTGKALKTIKTGVNIFKEKQAKRNKKLFSDNSDNGFFR